MWFESDGDDDDGERGWGRVGRAWVAARRVLSLAEFGLVWLPYYSHPLPHCVQLCPAYSKLLQMSRGGRGGGRGGFGGGGRGGFGAGNLPPLGLTFADIQSMSREQSEAYPVCFVCS